MNRAPNRPSPIEVDAPAGTQSGLVEDGIAVFRGIPYALAPTGDRRFAPPVDAPRTEGVRDATRFGSVSLQHIDPLPAALPGAEHHFYALDATFSEDCLNLNVWTPDVSGSAPVLVWIHGGAFMYGSGTGEWLSGASHARNNGIVVVTLNYRLGILGGLFLGDVDPQASNLALQDQMSALRWVKRNIASFGGDPSRVTVGGQSAGAMSVAGLLCAPEAHGLFARALIESGHSDATIDLASARAATAVILDRLHIPADDPDILGRLREISTPRILSTQLELGMAGRQFPLVTDDVILDADPLAAIAGGCAREVDLLIGIDREEDRLFAVTGWSPEPKSLVDTMNELLSDEDARARAVELYAAVESRDAQDLSHIIATEHAWMAPARRFAAAHAASGGRTWFFEFAWGSSVGNGSVGAAHLVELPFLFGTLEAPGVPALLGPEVLTDAATIALGAAAHASIGQFVSTGDLTDSPLGAWPAFTADNRVTMVMDRVSEPVRDRNAERLDFWDAQRDVSASPLSSIGAEA